MDAPKIISLIHGPDQRGGALRVLEWIYNHGGDVFHADSHIDEEEGVSFQRIEWSVEGGNQSLEAAAFKKMVHEDLGMRVECHLSTDKPNVALFVTKDAHCFHDLILRFKYNEYRGNLACVISNHEHLREETEFYGYPYHHIPVSKDNKQEAENAQLKLLRNYNIGCVVLARYMQILTDDFLTNAPCPIINIHHSFLPAFAGARPYHQAYNRGVKLIGATAHYATADLDEGPIIHQDVGTITHRESVKDFIKRGKEFERLVLAQALEWHLENRILVYNNKTVVFQ